MNIVTYATPGAFLADNQAYLRDHEVEAQLNLGNAVAHPGGALRAGAAVRQGGGAGPRRAAVWLFGALEPLLRRCGSQ